MSPVRPSSGCPVPPSATDRITLAHGEGGRSTRQFIASQILPRFASPLLAALGDAAVLPPSTCALAFTTDSHVVTPLFFPGGDIGTLAVFGTINDLVSVGAQPRWISLALILEEGLSMGELERVLDRIRAAAEQGGVAVVTGDTKVVPQGAVDKLFISTSGIGELIPPIPSGPATLQPGDRLLLSGPIAEHGLAILCARESLQMDPAPQSDCRPLTQVASALRQSQIPVRAMRDATRGGVAAVLQEWASACGHSLEYVESALPVRDTTRGLCELLGLDPIHIANEGVMVMGVPADAADRAVEVLRSAGDSPGAVCVGQVIPRRSAPVIVQRIMGPAQALDEPIGAPLPRIC